MPLTAPALTPAVRSLLEPLGSVIGGEWLTDGDGTIEVVDPATEEVVAEVPRCRSEDVTAAVAAARAAFEDGPWPRMSARERQRLIARLAERLDAHREELAIIGVLEVGSPITLSRGLHAGAAIAFFDWWADMALRGPHGRWEDGLGLSTQPVLSSSILFHEPVGVVAAISAYNFPLMITAFKIGGALASGCTSVLLPSPRTPLSAIAFMRILEEADFPPGVVNLVIGEQDVGRALTESPGVDLVSFTGSVAVGRQVMAQAVGGLKKVVLELGGKSPNVLLPGVDLEAAVRPSILRYARNSGQGCGCTTRILVHRDDYERFVGLAAQVIDDLVVGDPWDERTDLGPLIRRSQVESVEAFVQRALDGGGQILAGGGRPDMERGFYLNPSLVGNVSNDAEICQEELFGPVGVVIAYDTVEEAVALANDTRYGLNASVWGPTDEAMVVARRIRSGTVALNGGGGERPDAPWGGYGDSGIGHERGEAGFAEYLRVKHVQWPLAGAAPPPGTR
jgi:aldehyde dehydrogenase (NAD+)/betaine-aldehyde dehydrogenase